VRRTTVLALLCALAAMAAPTLASAKETHLAVSQLNDMHVGSTKVELQAQIAHSATVISFFRRHHWMRAPRRTSCTQVPWATTCARARSLFRAHVWLQTLATTRLAVLYPPPPTVSAASWECIHSHEGAWDSNTGNGYYGGLQMDSGFMSTYGPELLREKGTADHWTPAEQMEVAQKAHDAGRGYGPWPNTAAMCGLLSSAV
jgi:hypothetical protein